MDTGITLSRAQMSQIAAVSNPIDVTVKSAKGVFKQLAPTWGMVMKHKANTLAEAEYTEYYLEIIEQADWTAILIELKKHNYVTFMCYCPEKVFCHTHLLINYMLERWSDMFVDGRIH